MRIRERITRCALRRMERRAERALRRRHGYFGWAMQEGITDSYDDDLLRQIIYARKRGRPA